MIASGDWKIMLLGIVGSLGTGMGVFRNYVGTSWKVFSLEEKNKRKLREFEVYHVSTTAVGTSSTNSTDYSNIDKLIGAIQTLHPKGNAENFLNTVTGRDDQLFKRNIFKRCIELANSESEKKNIYVWRAKSGEFKEGDEKWYYFPKLQETDWLSKKKTSS